MLSTGNGLTVVDGIQASAVLAGLATNPGAGLW